MADRPIIFSAAMIAALLAGRKTQTRRLLKEQPPADSGKRCVRIMRRPIGLPPEHAFEWRSLYDAYLGDAVVRFAVGDRLYVRENHALVPSSAYRMSEGVEQTINPADHDEAAIYAAGWDRSKPRWRPSIHMPRWASRLTLLVTDVRVERLQDISGSNAEAEGIYARGAVGDDPHADVWTWQQDGWRYPHPWDAFKALWTSINGPESWAASPWVVAVSFSVHAGNIDQLAPIAQAAE